MTTESTKEDSFWEEGEIGQDEKSVAVVSFDDSAKVDEKMALQMISIRLDKPVLADMKKLAELYETGYQPLIREVLERFVAGEKKRIYNSYVTEKQKELECAETASAVEPPTNRRQA